MRLIDLTGQRFGRLVVVRRRPSRNQRVFWLCRCDCGKERELQAGVLRRGKVVSCGCSWKVDRESGEPACARPTSRTSGPRTGTRSGYLAHYYLKEPPCAACTEGLRQEVRQQRTADPYGNLTFNLQYKYRMSVDQFLDLLAAQDGRCAICGTEAPRDPRTGRLHVDHDHSCCPGKRTCGKCVRGLLCHACNTALGNFQDDVSRLRRAVEYLAQYAS